jgi:hypothetical protein
MRTIADQWALFEKLVIPANAPPIQRQEMRRAFYAGAEALLGLQMEIGDGSITEEAGVAIIEGWHDECRRFAAMVAEGKA